MQLALKNPTKLKKVRKIRSKIPEEIKKEVVVEVAAEKTREQILLEKVTQAALLYKQRKFVDSDEDIEEDDSDSDWDWIR